MADMTSKLPTTAPEFEAWASRISDCYTYVYCGLSKNITQANGSVIAFYTDVVTNAPDTNAIAVVFDIQGGHSIEAINDEWVEDLIIAHCGCTPA